MHMVQVPHLVRMGCTKPNVDITTAILGKNYPETIYGTSNLNLEQSSRKTGMNRGLVANLTILHLIKGSNANMHITIEFSGSNYPKIIYGPPCFENLKKKKFE